MSVQHIFIFIFFKFFFTYCHMMSLNVSLNAANVFNVLKTYTLSVRSSH